MLINLDTQMLASCCSLYWLCYVIVFILLSHFNEQKFCCFYSKETFLFFPPQPIYLGFFSPNLQESCIEDLLPQPSLRVSS